MVSSLHGLAQEILPSALGRRHGSMRVLAGRHRLRLTRYGDRRRVRRGASGVANTASGSGGGSAAPQVLWNRRFGENDFNNGDGPFGNHGVYAFAMDSQGAAILTGGSIGSIDFGDDEIPAAPFESG